MSSSSLPLSFFGGAITASIPSEVGSRYADVSNMRPVPDNQEVFMDVSGKDGSSLVVEILEFQNNVSTAEVAEYLFDDMMDLNSFSSGDCAVLNVSSQQGDSWCGERCPGSDGISMLCGKTPSMRAWLCVVRISKYSSEVAIWLYCPNETAEGFDGENVMKCLVDSFRVTNFALFG